MNVDYIVHSFSIEKVEVTTSFKGRDIAALVDGVVVELVGVGEGNNHGHTFRFVPDGEESMAAHKDLFAVGNHVRATFQAVKSDADQHDPAQQEHHD